MKTRDEVEELKRQWCADPCWDIETTEGFEEYRDELTAFSEMKRYGWHLNRVRALERKAGELGVPGNIILASYVLKLEARIEKLESIVYKKEEYDA